MKKKSPARKKAAAESSSAPTPARSAKRCAASPKHSVASEVEEQLKIGREIMKKYRETLKALAKM